MDSFDRKSEALAKVFIDGISDLKMQLKEDSVRHFFRYNVIAIPGNDF
jgi:hypothetical protein